LGLPGDLEGGYCARGRLLKGSLVRASQQFFPGGICNQFTPGGTMYKLYTVQLLA